MGQLPIISGRQARQILEKLGWRFARQSGSHMILVKPESIMSLSVPDHHELDAGTLRGLIRVAGISVDEFIAVWRRK